MDVKKCVRVCLGKWRWIYLVFCLWTIALAIAGFFRPDSLAGLDKFDVVEGQLVSVKKPRKRGYILVKVKQKDGGVISIVGFNNELLGLKNSAGNNVRVYFQEDISSYLIRPSGYELRHLEMNGEVIVSYKEMRTHMENAERKHIPEYRMAFVFILAFGSVFAYVRYCRKKLDEER